MTLRQARKLARTLHEFDHYIHTNQSSIPNYDDRYCNGEPISSSLAESSVNQIVSKRFVKKQHMRWTMRGTHLLLQIRTRVLDDTLTATFSVGILAWKRACHNRRSKFRLRWHEEHVLPMLLQTLSAFPLTRFAFGYFSVVGNRTFLAQPERLGQLGTSG